MMTNGSHASTIKHPPLSAEAVRNKNWYSDHDLARIKAQSFNRGKQYTKEQFKKLFDFNLKKAKTTAESIHVNLYVVHKVKTIEIKLKPLAVNSFKAIFIIPRKDFYSTKKFAEISQATMDLCKPGNAKDFHFSFLFMPFTKKIDEESFDADGFLLSYRNKD